MWANLILKERHKSNFDIRLTLHVTRCYVLIDREYRVFVLRTESRLHSMAIGAVSHEGSYTTNYQNLMPFNITLFGKLIPLWGTQ